MVKLDWVKGLKSIVDANSSKRPAKEIDRETDELFLKHMQERATRLQEDDPSFKLIPRFFDKRLLNKDDSTIHNMIQREARSRFLHHKTTEILDKEDLEKLWEEIRNNTSAPDDGTERLNYDSFLKIAKSLPPKCRHFFSASTFLKFDRDEYGRIDAVSFFHAVVRKVSLFQTRIQISLYDSYGNGYLLYSGLERFIEELLPTFPNLAAMPESLKERYMAIALAKFSFFLDSKKMGKVFIKDILTSPILAELYDLRSEKSDEEFLSNWFSLQNARKIIELFNRLDENKDGLLDLNELSKFQWGLTPLFLQRVLDQYTSSENGHKLDFKGFVMLILILENRKTNQSIHFLFNCIDIFNSGYIDAFVVNMFFKEVIKKLLSKDADSDKNFKVEDVKDEIFDMANPRNPKVITLQDLLKCGQGDTLLSIMVDAKAFFDYDQRELGNTLNVDEDSVYPVGDVLDNETKDNNLIPEGKAVPKMYGKYAEA